jgi:hypothetical protein
LRQSLDFECGETVVDRDRAGAEMPDREQVGKKLQAVAVVDEDPIAGAHPLSVVASHARGDLT